MNVTMVMYLLTGFAIGWLAAGFMLVGRNRVSREERDVLYWAEQWEDGFLHPKGQAYKNINNLRSAIDRYRRWKGTT